MSYVCFLYPVIFSFESKRPDWQQNNLGCFFCTAIVWGWGSSPTFCLCFMSDAHEHQNSDCSGIQNVQQMVVNPTPIWDGWILPHRLTVSHFFLSCARCITMSTRTVLCHLCGGLTWFAWPTLNAGLLVFWIQNWCGLFTAYLNTALRLDRFHKRRHHGSGRCRLVMSKWKGSGSVTMIKMWFTWGRLL